MNRPAVVFTTASETPVEAARRLEEEARSLAKTAADVLITDLLLISGRCGDLSTLSSLQPGVRDALRQLGEKIEADVQTIQSIATRTA